MKRDVARPFALVDRPVVVHRQLCEHLLVARIQTVRDAIEQPRPIGAQLLIQQLLRTFPILDPNETVILLLITNPFLFHLARQPFSPVDTYLNRERKPRLNPRVHPPQFRILPVLIHDQAFPGTLYQV